MEEGQCQRLKEPAGQGSGVGVWWSTWSSPHLSFWRKETCDRGSASQLQCEAQHMCERTMDQGVGDCGRLDKTVEEAEVRMTDGAEKMGWHGAEPVGTSPRSLR